MRGVFYLLITHGFVELSSLELILCSVKLFYRIFFSNVGDPKPGLIFIKHISSIKLMMY